MYSGRREESSDGPRLCGSRFWGSVGFVPEATERWLALPGEKESSGAVVLLLLESIAIGGVDGIAVPLLSHLALPR